jgi:hypothetical protein
MMWQRTGNTKPSPIIETAPSSLAPPLNPDEYNSPSDGSNDEHLGGQKKYEDAREPVQETPQTNKSRQNIPVHDDFITPASTELMSAVSQLSPDDRRVSNFSIASPKSTGSGNERGFMFHNNPKPTGDPLFFDAKRDRERVEPTPRIVNILPTSPASVVTDFSTTRSPDIPDVVMDFIKTRYQEVDREVVNELIDALSQPPTPRTATAATNIVSTISAKGPSLPQPRPDVPSTPISPNMALSSPQRHLPTVLEDIADIPPVPVTPEKPSIPPLPLDVSGLSTPQSQPPRPPRGNDYFPEAPLVESRMVDQPVMMGPVMMAPIIRTPTMMDPQGMMFAQTPDPYDPIPYFIDPMQPQYSPPRQRMLSPQPINPRSPRVVAFDMANNSRYSSPRRPQVVSPGYYGVVPPPVVRSPGTGSIGSRGESSETLGSGSVRTSPAALVYSNVSPGQAVVYVPRSPPRQLSVTQTPPQVFATPQDSQSLVESSSSAAVEGASNSGITLSEEILGSGDKARILPILFAAVRHNKFETVDKLLADNPKLIDSVDESNRSNGLLHVACINGYARIARLLIKNGINIDGTNADGNTPLHLCYQYGRNQLTSILLSNNANENARNLKDLIPAQMVSGASIPTSINPSPVASPPAMSPK